MTSEEYLFRIAIASLLVALLLVNVGRMPVVADAPPRNDRFGLCFISAADNLAQEIRYGGALATGAAWGRWPLYWHWVDEGGYVGSHTGGYHDYDTLIVQEVVHGITPIAILLGTPDRRATAGSSDVPPPRVQEKLFLLPGQVPAQQREGSTAASPPLGLHEPIFADGTDVPGPGKAINQANYWADFVYNTVQRYKPGGILAAREGWAGTVGVRHWEVWNEPDLNQFWTGTVQEYYRLLEVAYLTVKAADAGATVLLGGLAFYEKPTWLSDLLARTGGDPARAYFDVLSFHYYWSIYHGESWMLQARAVLDAHKLSRVPIWVTESGVPVWDDYPATPYSVPPDSPYRGTMEEQAAYVIQNAALAFYHGMKRYYHFMLHDDCGNAPPDAFGLRQNFSPHVCNPAQGKHRPSYVAYQMASEEFRGLVPLWRKKWAWQDQVAFYRADDRSRVVVLWATGGVSATATVNSTGEQAQLKWVEPTASPLGTTGITRTQTLTPADGVYTLVLPRATNQNSNLRGDTKYYIGGRPYVLVERDTRPPTSSVEPLPPTSPESFVVRWQGEDLGSGIASYDVWVSEKEGPLRPWLTATATMSGTFNGVRGRTYGFAVGARDNAGNEEPLSSMPQASTQVESGVTIGGPTRGQVNVAYAFTASVHFVPATPPIAYTWEATEQAPITCTSGLSHSVTFTWDKIGAQTITVTARGDPGPFTDTHLITIAPPRKSYLPLVLKERAPSLSPGPDLVVTGIGVDPASPRAGQPMTISVTVENRGVEPTSSWFFVDLYADPITRPRERTDLGTHQGHGPSDLEPGGSCQAGFSHTFVTGGQHTLYAQVDTYDGLNGSPDCAMICEANEANNIHGPVHVSVSISPCIDGIANGSFESDGDWELNCADYTTEVARAGYRSMRLGAIHPGDEVYPYSSARQLVTIPTDATSATLRFCLYPVSEETPARLSFPQPTTLPESGKALVSADAQYVLILDENNQVIDTLLWQRSNDQAWASYEFDLFGYAGRTIKLHFGVCNDGLDGVTGMYVDDVSLQVCSAASSLG